MNGLRVTTARTGIAWPTAWHPRFGYVIHFLHVFHFLFLTVVFPPGQVDYRAYMNKMWDALPAADLVAMASSPHFLGNQRIKTQHFVGASKWTRKSDTEITGYHQMRVAHQRYADDDLTTVLAQGHAHGKATIHYRNVEGEWKFAGLEPDIRWTEFDHDKIFAD